MIADIGGDLNIESQLDTSTAKAKQVNVSGSVGKTLRDKQAAASPALIRQPRAMPQSSPNSPAFMQARAVSTSRLMAIRS
ncbi:MULTISPECIES: hemagglutinin repeat-containing protein [Brucella/Ochrobactrum group]|uniref:hemagglutinin repeat-containing protein n=1 Tax=Brucella/Ochrobactrum group TaxID=2826938 RepID=UPI0002E5AEC9|nr:hemagglutinin repeat-containing protein [Brucella anthropi]MCQ9148318.1 hemagglutinin repeat-containing protein [Ochrobactrum sp. BTU2]KAB2742188.1 hypothetical protein F9K90_03790 [Brucella anthropi]KAB2746390.1 hypothetical protein F9L05_20040 [Brucella anthropi]KAB2754734.1 hypothetical protein F9K95_04505 [Brucella anthropi]KAB2765403.1 hypothetical protein F9K98_04555 [Brucella anthropi]